MKSLQTYVVREILKAFIPAFLALVLIMMLAFCIQLLGQGLDIVRLHALPRYILALSVPLVLPSAFLTAVIMGFGRLSADNEILAMRTSGVQLLTITLPVCAVAVLLSALTAYLHFQIVPRAMRNMEIAKNSALEQVFMDRVKLSARRQFRLPPYHVQYEDFRDGHMINVFILQTDTMRAPEMIITAASGALDLDPEKPGLLLLSLRDVKQIELRTGEFTGRGPVFAKVFSVPWRFVDDLTRMAEKPKYQALWGLLAQLRELKAEVRSADREIYSRPDRERKRAQARLRGLKAKEASKQDMLKQRDRELLSLQEDIRQKERSIELKAQEEASATERIELLKAERVSLLTEIQELQKAPDTGDGHARIAKNYEDLQSVNIQLEAQEARRQAAQADAQKARWGIAAKAREADEIQEEMGALERESKELGKQMVPELDLMRWAEAQDDLRSIGIRIHKYLAQSAAVLAFAMIGIPLGIMSRRRSIMVAIGISFAIVLVLFYPCLIVGQILAEVGVLPAGIAMWGGTALTFLIGVLLHGSVLRR